MIINLRKEGIAAIQLKEAQKERRIIRYPQISENETAPYSEPRAAKILTKDKDLTGRPIHPRGLSIEVDLGERERVRSIRYAS